MVSIIFNVDSYFIIDCHPMPDHIHQTKKEMKELNEQIESKQLEQQFVVQT